MFLRGVLVLSAIGLLCRLSHGQDAHVTDAGGGAPDPARQVLASTLSPDEQKACRKLFEELASEDFDARQQALNNLVSKGPAVLSLAQDYAKHQVTEVASQARSLHQRILFDYDGYLPTDPALRAALARKTRFWWKEETVGTLVKRMAEQAHITVLCDPAIALDEAAVFDLHGNDAPASLRERTFGEFLQLAAQRAGLRGVPRGSVYVMTTPEKAQRLAVQRHTFNWSGLGLNRDQAERAGKTLQSFLPLVTTEIHTGSEACIVRGEEQAIARAARLIALLQPGAPDAIWPPAPEATSLALETLAARLATPVTVGLAAEDPLDIIGQLRKQKVDVFVATGAAADGEARQEPPFPAEARSASPMRLALREQPAGLVLRWVERRARFPAEQQGDMVLGYEVGPAGRLQFRMKPKAARIPDYDVAGAEVGFLYPRGARPSAEGDTAVKAALTEALDSHLALFPACELSRDLAVLRGRMVMQGPRATLARALAVVREWRTRNAPPAPAEWKRNLDARLAASLEWDGRGMSGGQLISALRRQGRIDLLLEDAPDGSAAQFEFAAEDAQLLAPGKYPLRVLLDALAKRAGAEWRVLLGAVVVMPKTDGGRP